MQYEKHLFTFNAYITLSLTTQLFLEPHMPHSDFRFIFQFQTRVFVGGVCDVHKTLCTMADAYQNKFSIFVGVFDANKRNDADDAARRWCTTFIRVRRRQEPTLNARVDGRVHSTSANCWMVFARPSLHIILHSDYNELRVTKSNRIHQPTCTQCIDIRQRAKRSSMNWYNLHSNIDRRCAAVDFLFIVTIRNGTSIHFIASGQWTHLVDCVGRRNHNWRADLFGAHTHTHTK